MRSTSITSTGSESIESRMNREQLEREYQAAVEESRQKLAKKTAENLKRLSVRTSEAVNNYRRPEVKTQSDCPARHGNR